jgi:hypothetical protein
MQPSFVKSLTLHSVLSLKLWRVSDFSDEALRLTRLLWRRHAGIQMGREMVDSESTDCVTMSSRGAIDDVEISQIPLSSLPDQVQDRLFAKGGKRGDCFVRRSGWGRARWDAMKEGEEG